jgi:hypothetical protein
MNFLGLTFLLYYIKLSDGNGYLQKQLTTGMGRLEIDKEHL